MTGAPMPPAPPGSREHQITFRDLTRDDLPMMLRCLSDPDVSPWYEVRELTPEYLDQEFGAMIDGRDPGRPFIILIDDRPVGYIQTYELGAFPDYQRELDLEPDVVSTDLFLGEPDVRNHGWGAPVLRAFHRQIVFGEMQARIAAIMPSPRNERAIAAYRRAGFTSTRVATVYDPEFDRREEELIMLLPRTAFITQDAD